MTSISPQLLKLQRIRESLQQDGSSSEKTSTAEQTSKNLPKSNIGTNSHPVLLFLGTEEDRAYIPRMKSMVGLATVYLKMGPVVTISEVTAYCKAKGITGVISTDQSLLSRLLAAAGNPKKTAPSLDNYAGSMFQSEGIDIVFIHPLEQLMSVSYMPMLTKRFISKLAEPGAWSDLPAPKFSWELVTPAEIDSIFISFQTAELIAVDIETYQTNLAIRCIGYTAVWIDKRDGQISTHSVVLPTDTDFNLAWMRKFNWELQAPKIFQNGKYDCAYLARYNAPVYNYLWDTANMMHCWYSELPKDLAFLSAFFIRRAMYWKDLAETGDLYEYYKYNALDTQATAIVALVWFLQAPDWAKRNYIQEFPVIFPCHMSELTGVRRDMARLEVAAREASELIEKDNASLSTMVGTYPLIYNVNSAPQNKQLRAILGCSHIDSSDEKSLIHIGAAHPLNKRIVDKILDLRGNRKLLSTYLTTGEKAKELNERILYTISPHYTDTGRCNSRESHFWCGLQIQNVPRGDSVKQTIRSDDGFMFAECDLKQAESRDTGYISGDSNLIAAVESSKDFHANNAASFFGVPYDQIFSDELGKTLDKALRDLAKRTNHGANYLMGAGMLAQTMGDSKVWEAKRLLGLPANFGILETCEYLLRKFHATYPSLEKVFYPGVVHEVTTTNKLVSHTYHHDVWDDSLGRYSINDSIRKDQLVGWTRYCFGKPDKNKLDKNALVAHVPQNLNAMTLNKAYIRVFYDIAMHPVHGSNFKLCAQIHDSVLYQFRIGHEYLMEMVRARMEIPVTVLGYDGQVRTFIVPADTKCGPDGKGARYWNETE